MSEEFGFTVTDSDDEDTGETGASLDRLAAYGDITIVSALLAGASLAIVVEIDSDVPSALEGAAMFFLMLVASTNLAGTILLITQLHKAKRFAASHDHGVAGAKERRNSMIKANTYLHGVQRSRRFSVRGVIFSVPIFLIGIGIFTLARSTEASSIVSALLPFVASIVTIVGLYQQEVEFEMILGGNPGGCCLGNGGLSHSTDKVGRPHIGPSIGAPSCMLTPQSFQHPSEMAREREQPGESFHNADDYDDYDYVNQSRGAEVGASDALRPSVLPSIESSARELPGESFRRAALRPSAGPPERSGPPISLSAREQRRAALRPSSALRPSAL